MLNKHNELSSKSPNTNKLKGMVMYTCELRAVGVRGKETLGSLGITGHQPSDKFSYRSYLRGIKPLDVLLQLLHIYTHVHAQAHT